jgi:15-cis-phytoene desaturase
MASDRGTRARGELEGRSPSNRRTVAVLGGGVAGLTAAHELVERGFEVHVYEASPSVGGKAASQLVAGTAVGQRQELPGEHGFRFFPSFYEHVIDTMSRIPVDGGMVVDRLRPSEQMAMAEGGDLFQFARHPPRDPRDLRRLSDVIVDFFRETDVSEADMARFAAVMWRFMTSCDQRRLGELEGMSFWDYVEGNSYEPRFQKYIETPRFMVAMDPRKGSARTIGTKAVQILLDFFRNGTRTDAVLDGPTTERWIAPWRLYLEQRGVRFHMNSVVTELQRVQRRISGVRVNDATVTADWYVLALPLDRVVPLISDELALADKALAKLRELESSTSWMVGVQFFLRRDPQICRGHVAFPDSYWSLSSVSQGQFWTESIADRYGDGTVVDVLSVDISAWDRVAPRLGRAAWDCDAKDVIDEVWAQLVDGLGPRLNRADVVHEHLDTNMIFRAGQRAENTTPLLVHPPGSWWKRPGAELSGIENLLLASDYVKTNTDLASMESANEAAKRAVNGILRRENSPPARDCKIFSMTEDAGPAIEALKQADRIAFLGDASGLLSEVAEALGLDQIVAFTKRVSRAPRTMDGLRAIEDAALRMIGF